ncbi:decaheme c-type cytochrome, DmsE family [Bryocella elongata]|uniref:Decaheme c-type cytochrome, DmsE family n=1 Tax=Bryocella elongata TaxID=863522 RepID=A0A1H5S3W1_9BACT|nr:DmsE family decaheme c-type cytochrome [Bryocella elongata]SEF44517.1 decaheme c-type cytochrome, DmsE family [Bryocella elongata]
MRRLLLVLFSLATLAGFWTSATVAAGQQTKSSTLGHQAASAIPGAFAGAETCATCHADVANKFSSNPHSALALMHGGKGVTCEGCHGPGQAHVDSGGDPTKILQLSKMSAKQIDSTCLACHAEAHPNFMRSAHGKADVGCTSCHSIHSSSKSLDGAASLLKVDQPQLCFTCHADVKPAFSQPFHHKVKEGLIKCSDCHDAHGTFGNSQLRSTADQNMICTKCHTETRGPFVFEHAAVKAEGCLGCHTPHGSQNARLLNVPNVNQMCNQCHSPVAAGTIHGMNAGSAEVQSCVGCHTMIHGSNVNPAFIR